MTAIIVFEAQSRSSNEALFRLKTTGINKFMQSIYTIFSLEIMHFYSQTNWPHPS